MNPVTKLCDIKKTTIKYEANENHSLPNVFKFIGRNKTLLVFLLHYINSNNSIFFFYFQFRMDTKLPLSLSWETYIFSNFGTRKTLYPL